MKKFLAKVSEWGLVGVVVAMGLSALGMDAGTSKMIGGAAEQASDQAIERHVGDDE